MFPGSSTGPPLRVDGLMLIGGKPGGEGSMVAPSFVSASVSGWIGLSHILLLPVIVTCLFVVAAKLVKNLTDVPALPKNIRPGFAFLRRARPSFM